MIHSRLTRLAEHRHNPEINEVLSLESGSDISVTFTPHLVPMTRGMLTTTYAHLTQAVDPKAIDECLRVFYDHRPFVRICSAARMPDTLQVKGTNFCDIGFKIDTVNQRLVLISAIDNLVKGAAGQAVQNMNIMLGLNETVGLTAVPFPI